MVHGALQRLMGVLNTGLGVIAGEEPLATLNAPQENDTGGGLATLRLSLIKVDRDVSLQVAKPVIPKETVELQPAPLRLNMDVLMATAGGSYEDRLLLLENAMRVLHTAKSVKIGQSGNPERPLGIIQIELQNLDLHALSHIWSANQARVSPHAVYRLRGVQIVDADSFTNEHVIQNVNTDMNAPKDKFVATVVRQRKQVEDW